MTRLLDMGIEPFLVASSMVGVIAQRLVRVLCPKCKQPYKPTKRFLHTVGFDRVGGTPTFYRPVGCGFCNQIGYKGRTGVFEIMPVDDTIKTLIIKRAPSTEIKAAAIAGGMRPLQQAGLAKALAGITSFEEVMRVVFVED
jgi:type II secretory ATPase GspE/PulE/Tfp pilus assembly ATPase PilB-like protein